jgi:HEPN domain-containing protein
MTKNEIVGFWLEKSKMEIETANVMFNSGYYLYTGFMCHQAIEKILKAYYVHIKDERHPHIHSLPSFMKETGLDEKASENQIETITKLNPLYIEARYEDYKKKISALLTKDYTRILLTETEELHSWIHQFME